MKRYLAGAALLLAILAQATALDASRIGGWATKLSEAMNESRPAALAQLQRELADEVAAQPNDLGLATELGIVYHNLSRAQNAKKGYAAQAVQLLEKVVKGPSDEELKVFALPYLGSALALEARDSANPLAKIGLVNKGIASLDEAVSKYGRVSYIPRLLRANVGMSLPDFFRQLDKAGADLQALDAWGVDAWGADDATVMTPGTLSLVEDLLGNYYKKKGQIDKAETAWKKSVALDPQGKGAGADAAKSLAIYAR